MLSVKATTYKYEYFANGNIIPKSISMTKKEKNKKCEEAGNRVWFSKNDYYLFSQGSKITTSQLHDSTLNKMVSIHTAAV